MYKSEMKIQSEEQRGCETDFELELSWCNFKNYEKILQCVKTGY